MEQEHERDYSQFRNPHGADGQAVVEGMNASHYELTTWGLGFARFREDAQILDLGCGGGRTVERLAHRAPRGHVTGLDHSADCVRWATERNRAGVEAGRIRIVQASVDALPFAAAAFDNVFAVETVYFWPDLPKGLAEAARVTRPGGQFVLINEIYENARFRERNAEFRANGMRLLSIDEARTLLLKAGFSSVEIHTEEEKDWMCCVAAR